MTLTTTHVQQSSSLRKEKATMSTSISPLNIQAEFLREALSAPSLFADLAKVELYIAESYRSRAFIELLQNADDSNACRFLVRQAGKHLLVANDGRTFSNDDVVALCRSGASNKRRGGGSIGYRGIGFKSVAGIANEIDVISGDHKFRFSKSLTKQQLNIDSDVPLIRVPHPLASNHIQCLPHIEMLLTEGMKTVFILSGLDDRMIAEEAESFDESAMLFLNNIDRVEIELPRVKRVLSRSAKQREDGLSVEQIDSGDRQRHWLVASGESDSAKVAFALEGDRVVPASVPQSVIHSFMPTTEFSGALLKLNGDFSTDPSRKSVDMNDASVSAFDQCVAALANVMRRAVLSNNIPGMFSPFLLAAPVEGRFRVRLRDALLRHLDAVAFQVTGLSFPPIEIRLRPDWLPYTDYESLCKHTAHIPHGILVQHPQLPDFLRWLGAKMLSLEETLILMLDNSISPVGCAQIFSRAARQFRYDLTAERIESLVNAPLLPIADGARSCREYRGEPLLPEFRDFLLQRQESEDIRYLSKRLGLPDGMIGALAPRQEPVQRITLPAGDVSSSQDDTTSARHPDPFKAPPAIKAWRSAEQNALAWLSALSSVAAVKDVSQANVGYDIDVIWNNGQRSYVEVKSVARYGDAFRLTNNEHATAYQLGLEYLLAIVVNASDRFDIRFIRDPIRTLNLEKRCEQWSWYSENYLDNLNQSIW